MSAATVNGQYQLLMIIWDFLSEVILHCKNLFLLLLLLTSQVKNPKKMVLFHMESPKGSIGHVIILF